MATPSKPNIVLIFTDNQQASTLGCYGNKEIHTPHLNALANEGMVFDNAFCPNAYDSLQSTPGLPSVNLLLPGLLDRERFHFHS